MPFGQPMSFGALVHELRIQRGWTQEQLARFSGITVNSISNLEREFTVLPNAQTVERLARAFDVDPEDLDARMLAERVEREAHSLVQRQAIKVMLELDERDLAAVVARSREPKRTRRRRRRR